LPPPLMLSVAAPAAASVLLEPFSTTLQPSVVEPFGTTLLQPSGVGLGELCRATCASSNSLSSAGGEEDAACSISTCGSGSVLRGVIGLDDIGDLDKRQSESHFMQHSIAKQLSVLFDDNATESREGRMPSECDGAGEDEVEGTLIDVSTLADQLAAVCCSPQLSSGSHPPGW